MPEFAEETGYLSLTKQSQLSKLLHSDYVLEAHTKRHRQTSRLSSFAVVRTGPKATDTTLQQKGEAAARSLLREHKHLLSRTGALSARCHCGVDVMRNKAVMAESRRAVCQAQEVTRLTSLAFIHIPLSFTGLFWDEPDTDSFRHSRLLALDSHVGASHDVLPMCSHLGRLRNTEKGKSVYD